MKEEVRTHHSLSLSENFASTAQRVITVDVARYDEYLRESEMSPDQKEEFLRAMFSIVMTFVELGFGVHPLQQVDEREPCGKDVVSADQRPNLAIDGVRSKGQRTDSNIRYSSPSGDMGVE